MLGKLSKYFTVRKMPYFWVESFDLFSALKTKEIIDYGKILDEVCKKLKNDQAPLCYTKLSVHFKVAILILFNNNKIYNKNLLSISDSKRINY